MPRASWRSRLAWFAALWVASVSVLALAAWLMKAVMRAVGFA